MILTYPSKVGDQLHSSMQAEENLQKLSRVDARGPKEQVTTRVALECFNRIRTLRPGTFDAIKSWTKAGCVYVAGGAASIAALAAAGWGMQEVGRKTTELGYGPHLGVGLLSGYLISSKLGFEPVNSLVGLLVLTVRDAANRAADWSVHGDERAIEAREAEIVRCFDTIKNQLQDVFDDCAKFLYEQLEQTDREDINRCLDLKSAADELKSSFPAIEKHLKAFRLNKHEGETLLQRLKDSVSFIQQKTCELLPDTPPRNAEILARLPKDSIHEIAVPQVLRERILAAKQARFGIKDRCACYLSAVSSGAATLVATTAAVTAAAAGYYIYCNGFPTYGAAVKLWSQSKDWMTLPYQGAVLAAGAPAIAVTANKVVAHQQTIEGNRAYVEKELAACKNELKTLYTAIADHLQENTEQLAKIREKIPVIKKEIHRLGLVKDPSEILGKLG